MTIRTKTPITITAPFVKVAVDIERRIVSYGCDLHIDCAEELLKDGSRSENIWGANVYPDARIVCSSLVNIRPHQGNRAMEIQNKELQKKVEGVIAELLFP